ANHVVPLEIVSEQELEGVPLELTDIQSTGIKWHKNLAYNESNEIIDDLSFTSDYYHYIGTVEQTSDEHPIVFEPIAAKGLQIHAWIESRTIDKTKYESYSFRDVHKNGLSLQLNSNYVYKVVIQIQNPYTNQSSYYQFSIHSHKLSENAFKLDSMYLYARDLMAGDTIEVTIPKPFSKSEKDYVHSHVVTTEESNFDHLTGVYIADLWLDLSNIYDPETGELNGFSHNNQSGELAIKVIRNNDIVYDGVLPFDFSAVSVFDDVTLYKYSAEEVDQYNSDNNTQNGIVFEYDFSVIEGAAYIGQHYTLQPNVQEAMNINHFIKLVDGKFIHGIDIKFFPPGTVINPFSDGFYVYDSNYQLLGYAPFVFVGSEPQQEGSGAEL